jgi:uncharacterized protein YkwD/predicted nucleic acid binding AN1-type Zn finger protein
MAKCHVCHEEVHTPFTCNYCGEKYCSSHRLPERHQCPGLSSAKRIGPDFDGLEDRRSVTLGNGHEENSNDSSRESDDTEDEKSSEVLGHNDDYHECESCGAEVKTAHQCAECGGVFCIDHITPGGHSCVNENPVVTKNSSISGGSESTDKSRLLLNRLPSPSLPARRTVAVFLLLAIVFGAAGIIYDIGPGASVDEEPLTRLMENGADSARDAGAALADSTETESTGSGDGNNVATTTRQVTDSTASDGSSLVTKAPRTDRETVEQSGYGGTLSPGEIESKIHEGINEERQSRGLSRLDFDESLERIAHYHNKDMAKLDYFAHTAPDGETMGDRYDMFGYQCRQEMSGDQYATGAENIFKMRYSGESRSEAEIAEAAVEGWMNSEGHRENILKEYWENEGIDVYITNEDEWTYVYVTQNFC